MIFEGNKSNTGVHTQKHVQERKYEKHELRITLRRLAKNCFRGICYILLSVKKHPPETFAVKHLSYEN